MNTKQNIGPIAIAGAVILLIVLFFGLYKVFLAPKGPNPADAAAEHRDMGEFYRTQGHPNMSKH